MKKSFFGLFALFLLPLVTHAQSLHVYVKSILIFLDTTIIPFLLGIGFLFLVINVVRYFIVEGSDEDGRDKAKALATYSVLAFVIIVIFWGIVNMLVNGIGLGGKTQPTQDYVECKKNGTC